MTELVVKDNALIQASYTLDLVEQRLMLLAIMEARETGEGIAPDSLLQVHAHSYAEHFSINKETAYTVMKDASKGLFDRYVTYHDKNPKTGKDRSFHCRWVDKIGYEKDTGIVYLRFTHDVVPLITRLEQQFTSYDIEQISSLNSGYAIRLYELLIQWRSVGKTPVFDLQQFRQQLGVEETKYSRMSDFKKYVLDFAVQQINEHTDITVKYDQHKKGRVITGFTFKFKVKNKTKNARKSDSDTPDMLTAIKMTDKQRGAFASKLSQMSELSSYAKQGEDYKQFAGRIETELLDEKKQAFYIPYLEKLGFESNR
ncbi:RepB family plasmid replication initiator protein (plasmid) [Psychrobacter sp. L7]|uniref:replication initiation protein RepM n=1 Tax=Psychrobacter sp. L7 TaxID=1982756 RepID=UPI000C2A7168|nr:replication initiation protein RepM [Psychrobacter sp. L7]PJX20103.1 RepB family plasmid replication initiator protein [Psychrobacter sp. L7]